MTTTAWAGDGRFGRTPRRLIAVIGALFIAAIVGLTVYDGFTGYRTTERNAAAELNVHARIVAEQTTRSLQAVDVVLRFLASEHDKGAFNGLSTEALSRHLSEQSVGLVQTMGIAVFDGGGSLRGYSRGVTDELRHVDASTDPQFRRLHESNSLDLIISDVRFSRRIGQWVVPVSRALRTPQGKFDGSVTALLSVDYFQNFYRDVFPTVGMHVLLLSPDHKLLARFPPEHTTLGQQFSLIAKILASYATDEPILRARSPIDGVDRMGAARMVPDYGLVVIVARDAQIVFANWRSLAWGLAVRTLALATLAGLLIALTLRQLVRLDAARGSLEVSEKRYALAAAGSDDGLWDWDLAAGVGYESARARDLQGLALQPETQPLDVLMALPTYSPEDAAARRSAMADHLEGRTEALEGDYCVRHGDGTRRWIHVRGLCIRDAAGSPLRVAGSVSDIDARKRGEESLRRSEERYHLAVLGSNEGMWDWDMTEDMLFLSPRAQEVAFGASGEPLLLRSEWNARAHYHADDVPRLRQAVVNHLRGATPHFTVEFRMRHPADRAGWHWCRQRGIALRDAGGRAYRMAGSIEDITARKEAEAGHERLEKQLRQAQKLEAIGTLAGGIAHDFNNILAAILGFGELARSDASPGSRQRMHIDAALAAGARAKSLVERILAFSRTGMGERVPVHAQSVVTEALDTIAATLPAGIRLERRLAAGDAGVIGDPTQIHQVVMNLCANAVQATSPPGVVAVSADVVEIAAALTVNTTTLASGRYVRLAVRDTGSGIPAHLLERIFDPFFTTKEVGVGTGLGLSLVHGIVTDLGGGVVIESKPGEGSVFTAYFRTDTFATPTALVAQSAPRGEGQAILLVDDETALVELGEETLAALGYEPVGFASSAAALEAFDADPGRFDAVLSDEAMPGMTGCDLAAEIRARRAEIPIVLLSGFVTAAMVTRAREVGVDMVLGKPLATAEVARALAAVLGSPRRDSQLDGARCASAAPEFVERTR